MYTDQINHPHVKFLDIQKILGTLFNDQSESWTPIAARPLPPTQPPFPSPPPRTGQAVWSGLVCEIHYGISEQLCEQKGGRAHLCFAV